MSAEANKMVARRYYDEIMNAGDLAVIDELMTPDFLFTLATHPEPFHGPDGFKRLVTMLHDAFPDVHLSVELLVAEGDTVVGQWTGSGTHTGGPLSTVLGDVKATGRHFVIDGMSWLRIRDGKIAESLANEDSLGLLIQLGVLPGDDVRTTSTDENRELIRRYVDEVMNRGQLDVLDVILSPNFVFRIPTLPEPVQGIDGMKRFVAALRSGFPDIKYGVDREVAEGDKVALRWLITGTHLGEFLGVPATGNKVEVQGSDIFSIVDGRLAVVWVNENDLGLMRQIGAIQSPAPASG